jgi:photosystem II stability/assembly factor-like uncharacterized protein
MRSLRLVGAVALAVTLAAPLPAQMASAPDTAVLNALRWRSIGPANMAGRITDLAVSNKDPRVFWVAYATGGIWRTKNGGTTFTAQFDKEAVISLGALTVAPSNPDILYAGTGEEDSRNSISPGGGVYKSTDGGATWTRVGLEATQHIGRIVVHPANPDIAWVAAVGAAWTSNPDRGLYKTVDGGKSWTRLKAISDKAGFVDIAMDPINPDVLWAASWERVRGAYFLNSGGPGSALWRSADGGTTWTEVAGGGFPATTKGRIGIAIAPSNPKVVYAMVEADTAPRALAAGEKPDTTKRAKRMSGLYRTTDGGATWTLMFRNLDDARPFYYSQVRVDPKNPDRVYWMSSTFRLSDDGGKTAKPAAGSIHTDWHAMWINPADPEHLMIASDGGLAVSRDKATTFDFVDNVAAGQFYEVSFDYRKPYWVCGGLQDNGSWCGPSRVRSIRTIQNSDWTNIGGGDGFYTAQDPDEPNIVYSESQGGMINRLDLATGFGKLIRRSTLDRGIRALQDSLVVIRGDTTVAATPAMTAALDRIKARMHADSTGELRFNWQTPFFLSAHDPKVLYAAGNRVMRSANRGDDWRLISPDLSVGDTMKVRVSLYTTGGITNDATGAETHGTVTTLAESPVRAGLLYAGTDDGKLWMTKNDGATWTDLSTRFPGVPAGTWVSRIEPSRFDTNTVYVTFDGHRTGDFAPYVYVSDDGATSFRSITSDLPRAGAAFVHVVREDPRNRHLLFVGTDLAPYVSVDRGAHWSVFAPGLPTVPVHDLRIHPRDRELIAGTHGRSVWIADIAPLEQLADSIQAAALFVFTPRTAFQYASRFEQAYIGDRTFRTPQPPYGAHLYYRVGPPDTASKAPATTGTTPSTPPQAKITILTLRGDTIRTITGPVRPGVHRVVWDLRTNLPPLSPSQKRDSIDVQRRRDAARDSVKARAARDSADRAAGRTPAVRPASENPSTFIGMQLGARPQRNVEPGEYVVVVQVGTRTVRTTVRVERVGEVGRDVEFFGTDDGAPSEPDPSR